MKIFAAAKLNTGSSLDTRTFTIDGDNLVITETFKTILDPDQTQVLLSTIQNEITEETAVDQNKVDELESIASDINNIIN